jgi:spore germination protein
MSKAAVAFLVIALATPLHGYRMSAWVPAWDDRALVSMQMNAGKLDEANPGWYSLTRGGGIARNENAEAADLRAALSGVALVPTIANFTSDGFDGSMVAGVVQSPALRESHAASLAQLAMENAFDGIDIDYESVPAVARDGFTAFVRLLAEKLHGSGRRLSVTVHAKTSDADTWDGPGAEDWRAIGAVADTVKIMAYDYHWDGSDAGPIAPVAWLDAIAVYAEETIPAQKVIMALPWYGYDWQGTTARALVYSEAIALASSVGAHVDRDDNGEATFSYGGRVVFFQDAESYRTKVGAILAKHPRIGGFAHWRAGGEDPAIWVEVERLHATAVPPPARRRAARH